MIFLNFLMLLISPYIIGWLDWGGKVLGGTIVDLAILCFWSYNDDDSFCLTFELIGNMNLSWVHPSLWEKCEGYNNLTNEYAKL
jgi:hypothetical protein